MSNFYQRLRPIITLGFISTLSLSSMIASTAYGADTPTDFTGVWMAYDNDSNAGPFGGGPSALSESGQALVDAYFSQYTGELPEQGSYCVPPGMPSTMTSMVSYPIEIIHSENRITMLAELEMQVRRIFMDGREHPDNYPDSRMGHSIAVWEGETLVIDTTLLKESLMGGWPRTNSTHIVERIYIAKRSELDAQASGFLASVSPPVGDDALVIEITMSDDTLYSAPRQITMYYQRINDDAILEYDCAADLWRQAVKASQEKTY